MPKPKKLKSIAENAHSTVVAQYDLKLPRATKYQSEAALEDAFVKQLEAQGYEYITLSSEGDLEANVRKQLEKLNDIEFSDDEWKRFFATEIANPNQSIKEKTRTIQEDFVKVLKRDDGSVKNIMLINKESVHENVLQVMNQYAVEDGKRPNRYDVTILVNGLPLVHVELKRRGVAIQEAFNQIERYQRESFWAQEGLFEYVQLFVISNGTHTKYYSNTTRHKHVKEQSGSSRKQTGKRSSNSFEFTSWWSDAKNQAIMDLMAFTGTFFAKNSLLNVLTKYCVFTVDEELLVLRPYQIVAAERIIEKVVSSTNAKKYGSVEAGGYVWHTTGSGKTLTSFKTAQLASKLPYVDKVLFVVDRKDLDHQTMREYEKFKKGAVSSNKSTRELAAQLKSKESRIIVTTIQKLDNFIKRNQGHEVFGGHVVIIFDECHRSQFGDMHSAITKAFKKYHLFGFTGTPIFKENAPSGVKFQVKTTEQAFGKRLHEYTIVDAIADGNVLKFRTEFVSTVKMKEEIDETKVLGINREEVLKSPIRIQKVVEHIFKHFGQKTLRSSTYTHKGNRVAGFNSMFAVESIEAAKLYYSEFKKQNAKLPSDKQLKVGLIYSFGVNDEDADGMLDENSDDTTGLGANDRDFLEKVIEDYNKLFGTNFDTSAEKFPNYYKNVSERIKDREIDVMIVVNMFLTGFDATTLNTLWVDKNLRMHGLVQAFSRTNRILNSVKKFGNIICFRNLEKATNEALALFGNKDAVSTVLIKPYKDHAKEYMRLVAELQKKFSPHERIIGEAKQKEFIKLWGAVLRLRNVLSTFDEFEGNKTLSERDFQDYQSNYLQYREEFYKEAAAGQESILDDVIFEMELVKQAEIGIDYILNLIAQYKKDTVKNKKVLDDVERAISSSAELRNKKDLIEEFIAGLNPRADVEKYWQDFVGKKKVEELENIIASEKLNEAATRAFVRNAFRDGAVVQTGTAIADILPPMSRFDASGDRARKRESVLSRLTKFFERFFDITE